MEISIKHEMLVFWGAFFCGQIIPFLFDFFRAMRKSFVCNKNQVVIQDIIFCFLSFKIFFDVCYFTNNGHLRWYIFISFILSMLIYFLAESTYVIKFWSGVFKILRFFLSPVRNLICFVSRKSGAVLKLLKSGITHCFDRFLTKTRHFLTKGR